MSFGAFAGGIFDGLPHLKRTFFSSIAFAICEVSKKRYVVVFEVEQVLPPSHWKKPCRVSASLVRFLHLGQVCGDVAREWPESTR